MSRTIKAAVLGMTLSLIALMPFWLQTDVCDIYVQEYVWAANLPDPNNPFGLAACHDHGPDLLDFVTLFYLIGMLGLGLVLAARIAQQNHIRLASSIGGASVIIAAVIGMLISGLPLRLLLSDYFFVAFVAAATLFGAVVGVVEQRRFMAWHRRP